MHSILYLLLANLDAIFISAAPGPLPKLNIFTGPEAFSFTQAIENALGVVLYFVVAQHGPALCGNALTCG
jgi:hypothetical protein